MLARIESLPRFNIRTVRAFHIREKVQLLYKESTQQGFEALLKKWYFWATHSRTPEIGDAAKTVKRHREVIIRLYTSTIENGILERLDSLIQAAKARARGYGTFENCKTIIYLITAPVSLTSARQGYATDRGKIIFIGLFCYAFAVSRIHS